MKKYRIKSNGVTFIVQRLARPFWIFRRWANRGLENTYYRFSSDRDTWQYDTKEDAQKYIDELLEEERISNLPYT